MSTNELGVRPEPLAASDGSGRDWKAIGVLSAVATTVVAMYMVEIAVFWVVLDAIF